MQTGMEGLGVISRNGDVDGNGKLGSYQGNLGI